MASLNVIALTVKDIAASLDFYQLLGIDTPDDVEGQQHVEATTESGLRLAWDSVDLMQKIHPELETNPVGQRITLAFLCDSPQAVNHLYSLITEHGHEGVREPWDAFWGQRYAVVKDPDGNLVDLFAPLPSEDTDA